LQLLKHGWRWDDGVDDDAWAHPSLQHGALQSLGSEKKTGDGVIAGQCIT